MGLPRPASLIYAQKYLAFMSVHIPLLIRIEAGQKILPSLCAKIIPLFIIGYRTYVCLAILNN